MLQYFGADVEITGTEFVEKSDAFVMQTLLVGNLPCNLLAKGDVQAKFSGHELVILVWVATRLVLPKLMTIDGV